MDGRKNFMIGAMPDLGYAFALLIITVLLMPAHAYVLYHILKPIFIAINSRVK
jgi:hypothetical protein